MGRCLYIHLIDFRQGIHCACILSITNLLTPHICCPKNNENVFKVTDLRNIHQSTRSWPLFYNNGSCITWLVDRVNWLLTAHISSWNNGGVTPHSSSDILFNPSIWQSIPRPSIVYRNKKNYLWSGESNGVGTWKVPDEWVNTCVGLEGCLLFLLLYTCTYIWYKVVQHNLFCWVYSCY